MRPETRAVGSEGAASMSSGFDRILPAAYRRTVSGSCRCGRPRKSVAVSWRPMDSVSTTPRRVWVEAIRPRTLPAAIAPVLVGTAASATAMAWSHGQGPAPSLVRFLLAGAVALLLQVAVNFANDYFDGVGEIDNAERIGPLRGVGSGLVAPATMKRAMIATLAAAAVTGLLLALLVGWELLLVGVAALVATVGYSGGPRPYASAGLGEVFVFIFFGLVATVGSAYVQDEALSWVPFVAAIPMGLFAVAMLVVNNLRDIATDRDVGKHTLAVRIGDANTRRLYVALVVAAFVVVAGLLLALGNGWLGLVLVTLPLVGPAILLVRHAPPGPRLVQALGLTGRAQLLFAVLLSLGLMFDGWVG